ncbi:glycosyltransferase involved in cell wall biosynthesis [Gramella sp. Hel_I_59]|uniref:glycosyltransferase family 4 protein n=1 Tax=Gramella sp. Hel_I_59 TaxID=1249978 RepID=UPI00114E9B89|nr:glycosyltransferase family 4 protein [Gramella sp. Hel_I_59]TQI71939.1 glycosyltransferase involved in cell wall biosynthesis [Gramella sp. Hel_I_59]
MKNRLAVVITHPIQYYAPMFRLLAEEPDIEVKVFYTWSQAKEKVKDKTFGKDIQWDIPLLNDYNYEFVENFSKSPGSNKWNGIENPELIKKIKEFHPGAILVFGWNMKSHFKVMKYFKGKVPVWFRGDSTLLDETKGLKTLARRLVLKYVYNNIDKAFYVGRESKRYFLAHGLKEKELVFAPHAIDNDRFFDATGEYELLAKDWRGELGYTNEDIVILFAGKFEQKKNPLLLVNAIKSLHDENESNLKLLLLGNGPLEAEIDTAIRDCSFIKKLPFQNQSKMPVVYRIADIFCLPSKGPGETWGLAVNEAMACSRPVLVSDKVGCAPDLVQNNNVGEIFESGNLEDLKIKLRKMYQTNLKSTGKNAKEVIAEWNFNKISEAIKSELQ